MILYNVNCIKCGTNKAFCYYYYNHHHRDGKKVVEKIKYVENRRFSLTLIILLMKSFKTITTLKIYALNNE